MCAFADSFDASFSLRYDLEQAMDEKFPLTIPTDSQRLFNVAVDTVTTTQMHLMADFKASREALVRYEIENVGSIATEDNVANGLTKIDLCRALEKLLQTVV